MKMQKISPKAKTLWLIRNAIWLVIITAGALIALLTGIDSPSFTAVAAITGASWLTVAVLLLIFPSLSYKNYSYGYDDKRFTVKSGVIFRHTITAPVCQIQDLHFYEGPVMRLLGIGKIMLSTGGSNFELVGLDKATAQTVIEELEEKLRRRIEEKNNETL